MNLIDAAVKAVAAGEVWTQTRILTLSTTLIAEVAATKSPRNRKYRSRRFNNEFRVWTVAETRKGNRT